MDSVCVPAGLPLLRSCTKDTKASMALVGLSSVYADRRSTRGAANQNQVTPHHLRGICIDIANAIPLSYGYLKSTADVLHGF